VATNGTEPPGSYGMTSIFDAVRNRMLIFGGSTSESYYGTHNNTWELDLNPEIPQWRQVNPAGTLPDPRRSLTSIFDPRRDRMVIFGGGDPRDEGDVFFNDTWALSLSTQDGEWTQLAPGGSVPGVRATPSAVYDPRGDQMVLFGGWGATVMLGDTQFLTWNDEGEAATASSSAEAETGVNMLEWSTHNTVSSIGAVYRREPGTEWTSMGVVEADGQGVISFQDNSVTPGQDYGYQIVVSSAVGDEFIGEVWLTNPTPVGGTPSATMALQVWPNPAVGPLAVSLTLAADNAAQLEMFNVRGQRVLTREVGAMGAGAHRLEIGRAQDYPSGIYFLRLTQSGHSVSSRFVVVR
jgi:Secretion system C-terminal sorting domain/Galactose oxidase, central domain